jgi:membrane protein implicated in regulation of membrane protease activity
MSQTRVESLIESSVNIASGFIISLIVWSYIVVPIWDIPVSMSENLQITALFTIVSIIRSYVWRRFFNAALHRRVHSFVRGRPIT